MRALLGQWTAYHSRFPPNHLGKPDVDRQLRQLIFGGNILGLPCVQLVDIRERFVLEGLAAQPVPSGCILVAPWSNHDVPCSLERKDQPP